MIIEIKLFWDKGSKGQEVSEIRFTPDPCCTQSNHTDIMTWVNRVHNIVIKIVPYLLHHLASVLHNLRG